MLEFRFYLENPVLGRQLIDEPVGWEDTEFTLKRDPKYHSVLFEYSTELQFWGKRGKYDGGKTFIKTVEDQQGIDGQIILICEISDHGSPFIEEFRGLLDLSELEETEVYIQTNVKQLGLIETFNKRANVTVDFSKRESIDGVVTETFDPQNINLHSKVIKRQYLGDFVGGGNVSQGSSTIEVPGDIAGGTVLRNKIMYMMLGFNNTKYAELSKLSGINSGFIESSPIEIFESLENGTFSIDFNVNMTAGIYGGGTDNVEGCESIRSSAKDWRIEFFFEVRDKDENVKEKTKIWSKTRSGCYINFPVSDVGPISLSYNNPAYPISIGDKIYIYGEYATSARYYQVLNTYFVEFKYNATVEESSYLNISALTTFPETAAPAFRLHEAFNTISNSLVGKSQSFYSEYFGAPDTVNRPYPTAGCGHNFTITNGYLIRGFPWAERPIQISWNELYDSTNAIFNVGMGIEDIDGEETIRVEPKTYFYDKEVILYFDNVNGVRRTIAKDKYVIKIEVGYEKWESESINGLDEFNTHHQYVTVLKTVGEDLVIKSKLIAAGSAIELARRQRYNETVTTDFKLDKDNFIITVDPEELNFAERNQHIEATNVLSPETSYNLRITPKRNLLRWGNYINGGLLKYQGSKYKFTYGEGNYKMVTDWENTPVNQCPGNYNFEPIAENDDFSWVYADSPDVEPLWEPVIYEFEYPLSFQDFKKIRDNKNKAIAFSETGEDFIPVWILDMKYKPNDVKASFTCLKVNTLPYNYIPEDKENLLLQDGTDLYLEDETLLYL